MTAAEPKVIHLIPHDGVGGVEVAARSMADSSPAGIDFRLVLLAGRTLAKDKRRIFESPFGSALNPLAQIRAAMLCRRIGVDVLIFSLWRSIPAALLVKLLKPSTRLAFFLNVDRVVHLPDALLSRLAIAVADQCWADSAVSLEARLGAGDRRGRVISFVTHRLEPVGGAASPPQLHFVTWSRLNHQKGIDRSLRLIAQLARSGAEPRFDIWGPDGGEGGKLKALAAELGIGDRIAFHGPAEHEALPGIARGQSFFLQLSRFEGMGMSVVEAMQLGLVPVVTPVGEIPRYVSDGGNGVLVDPKNLAAAAGRAMALIGDARAYAAMRQAAIDRWSGTPLYREDAARAARALMEG